MSSSGPSRSSSSSSASSRLPAGASSSGDDEEEEEALSPSSHSSLIQEVVASTQQQQQPSPWGMQHILGHRRTAAVSTIPLVVVAAVPAPPLRVGGDEGFFVEAFFNAEEEQGRPSGVMLMMARNDDVDAAVRVPAVAAAVVDEEPVSFLAEEVEEEGADDNVSSPSCSVDSPRETSIMTAAAPAATVEVSCENRTKTHPTGGFDVAVASEREKSATTIASDDEPEEQQQQHRSVSSVSATTTLPVTQLDGGVPGPAGIRTNTAGGQNFLGADAAVGTRGRSTTTTAATTTPVAPGEIRARPSSSRERGEVEGPPNSSSPQVVDIVFVSPPVPPRNPARLLDISLSGKRRIKQQQQQQRESCSQPPRSTPVFPPPLNLPAVSGLSGGPGFEDIPPVPPLRINRSPSVVLAADRPGFPPPPNRPLPPIPGQSVVPLGGTQVQLGECVGVEDVEYEGDVEESNYEDSDSRESLVQVQQGHGGGRPRLYAPSLSTIRDSSPAPPLVAASSPVLVASATSSSSLVGTPNLRRSFTASDEYGAADQRAHAEESPTRHRGSDATALGVAYGETSFVQGDRRRWGMVPHMLGGEAWSRLASSSPTPSSSANSERTARPARTTGEEQEEVLLPPADTNDDLLAEEAGFAIDNSAILQDFGEGVPSREEGPAMDRLVEDPVHGSTTTLEPMTAEVAPLRLRRAPAMRRGSTAVTSTSSPRPQPQPQPERQRPNLYTFPRPPYGLRPDGGSSTRSPRPGGTASASASGDGGLVSSVTVGVTPTTTTRPPYASGAGVEFPVSSGAHDAIIPPIDEASTSGPISPGVLESGSGSGSGLSRGLTRSATHAIVPPPMPLSSPPPIPGGFARSATQALPRPGLPMSTTFGGAIGGNNSSRFGTGMRSVSAPRPMGAPTEGEDEFHAGIRTYIGRTQDRYEEQRAALRPGHGLRSRTQTLGTFPPSTITSPPTSSGRGSGSGSHQLSGSSMATLFLGSPTSPGMMGSPTPPTPGFTSPSFPSGSSSRGRGRGRSSRGSRGSRGSASSVPQVQPQPRPEIRVEMRERGPAMVTVRDPNQPERPRSEPAEEPRSYWSSDTEEEPSAIERVRTVFSRLRTRSRGNLRREASSSFSTTNSLSPVTTRDGGPPRHPDIPPVPPLPTFTSGTSPIPSIPIPPIPTNEDNDNHDDDAAANQAGGGSQRQKQLKKKKSLANLFGKKREE
ncbi:hypothetical protein B0T09DRAFT_358557 [Sordaria sp. MPI-SDFR-AT-0083]|nr:hypothetical protein B0T09DRAFT_358557 [Sordaria sp. MPI-SDFR-AT-0083]